MADDAVQVVFGAEIEGVVAGVNEIKEQIEGLAAFTQGIVGTFQDLQEAMVAAFAVEQIASFIEKLTDLGLQTERTSQQLALTTEQVGLLNYTANQFDVPAEQVRHSLERLEQGLQQAAKGGNEQAAAFQLMGVNAQQFIANGGTTWELIQKIAEATARLSPTLNLGSAYIAAMGKSGADLLPVFEALGANMDAFKDKAQAAGAILSEGMVSDLERTQQGIKNLGSAFTGLGLSIFEEFKPGIDGAIEGMTQLVEGFSNNIREGGAFGTMLSLLSGGFDVIVLGIAGIVDGFKLLANSFRIVIQEITETVTGIAVVIHDAFTKGMEAARADVLRIGTLMQNDFKTFENDLTNNAANFAKIANTIAAAAQNSAAGTPSNGANSPGKKTPNLGATSASDQVSQWQAQLNAMLEQQQLFYDKAREAEMQFWQQKLQVVKQGSAEYNDIESKIYELDKQQEAESVSLHLKALDQQQAADKGDFAKVMQLEDQKLAFLAQVYGKDAQQYQEELLKKQQMDTQHIQQTQQRYSQLFQGMFRSFNSSVEGILRGTQTLSQGMADLFWDMADSVAKVFEKMLADQIIYVLTGKAVQQTAAEAQIQADASRAAAGAYAAVAGIPIVGPELAPAAAAVAYAGVMAFENMASFDVGSWNVPGDMIAQIHEGETILPKPFAQSFRENGGFAGGGGGGDIHFHVSAVDGASVAKFFKNNSGHVVDAIVKERRNRNSGLSGMR